MPEAGYWFNSQVLNRESNFWSCHKWEKEVRENRRFWCERVLGRGLHTQTPPPPFHRSQGVLKVHCYSNYKGVRIRVCSFTYIVFEHYRWFCSLWSCVGRGTWIYKKISKHFTKRLRTCRIPLGTVINLFFQRQSELKMSSGNNWSDGNSYHKIDSSFVSLKYATFQNSTLNEY